MRGSLATVVARWGRATTLLVALLAVLVVVHGVSTIPGVRSHEVRSPVFDEWIQGSAYVLCGVLAILGARRSRSGTRFARAAAITLALAVVLRGVGFVVSLAWVLRQPVPAYPSLADAAWIGSALLLLVTLVLRLRSTVPRVGLRLALDAIAVSLLTAGIAIEAAFTVLVDLNPVGAPADVVATNLAYPVLDVAIVVAVLGLVSTFDWRPSQADLVLIGGVLAFAVIDVWFLYQVSAGTFRPGSPLASLSLVATSVIALSLFTPAPEAPLLGPAQRERLGYGVAATTGLLALAFFLYDDLVKVPIIAVLLVSASMLVVLARGITTLVGDRADADTIIAATNEELLRFQALVETSSDFIAIAGMDGQVIYVNPAGRELVGLPPDRDVTTTTIVDYLTEEGIRASIEIEQPAVVANGRWEGESSLRDMRGGPPIPVAIASFLMLHPTTRQPFALATVQRDISERLATQQALEDLAGQRQTLLSRLVQAQEDERARIAVDVHDDSVQALAAVDLRLGLLRRKLVEAGSDQVENIDKALHTVGNATTRLRHLLFDLESPAQHSTLSEALASAADFVFEDSGVTWEITGDRAVDLPESARVVAYRIAKEAMVNVCKHAQADRVELGLSHDDDGVLVTIADDGVGVQPDGIRSRRGHRGLASIRDQATIAGGWLRVEGSPDEGTRVLLWLPDLAPGLADEDGD